MPPPPPPPIEEAQARPPAPAQPAHAHPTYADVRNWFSIPPSLKKLFDHFPLVVYPANDPPLRSPTRQRQSATLYLFTSSEDALLRRPSFNPTCLKWQTYLKFNDIPFSTVSSNNHASPSGALPFLLPGHKPASANDSPAPIVSSKLEKWVLDQGGSGKTDRVDIRYDAYLALLDYRIRNAWLCSLYLDFRNSQVMRQLYVDPCSSNPLVQETIVYQLRTAAHAEILKTSSEIDFMTLYVDAQEAFVALAALLGEKTWFFDVEKPTLFDASVFAYTHLLLDEGLGWKGTELSAAVGRMENLVRHRDHILSQYYRPVRKEESLGVAS
ncbi:MAG: hypothetical protein M1816_001800 [Peltula sp. TS41687]|nr:MAG: hypothetical protein M1816_001800 [Peltula sp. TS41687]